jgi:hypothetical protein
MSGFGTFSYTTIQGKGNHHITFIAAYIAVMKGSQIGTESLYAQQTTIYERHSLRSNTPPSSSFCPRSHSMKNLNKIIEHFQKEKHAVVLMLDANQSQQDCYNSKGVINFSIQWLKNERGLDDPFVQLIGHRPNSTTLFPNHDIDYILTHGIDIRNISTLPPNNPSHSDHLEIIFDIDIHSYFSSTYSELYLLLEMRNPSPPTYNM